MKLNQWTDYLGPWEFALHWRGGNDQRAVFRFWLAWFDRSLIEVFNTGPCYASSSSNAAVPGPSRFGRARRDAYQYTRWSLRACLFRTALRSNRELR